VNGAARLAPLTPGGLSPRQLVLFREITDVVGGRPSFAMESSGGLPGPFNAFLFVPETGAALLRLGESLLAAGALSPAQREAAILAVGGFWEAEYMCRYHRADGRAAGLDDEQIEQIIVGADPAGPETISVVVRYCRELLREHAVTEATYEQGVALLGTEGVVSLTCLIGFFQLIAGILRSFGIGHD
jgi:4-carboxymuconolactone decarboxylase